MASLLRVLILGASGFGSHDYCETVASTDDDGGFSAPHDAGSRPECGHGPNPSGYFRAAAEPAAVLELLYRVREVLGKGRLAPGRIDGAPDVGEAGDVPKSANGEPGPRP